MLIPIISRQQVVIPMMGLSLVRGPTVREHKLLGCGGRLYLCSRRDLYAAAANTGWTTAASHLGRSGSAREIHCHYCLFWETPTFTVPGHGIFSFGLTGSYIVVDGLTFGSHGNLIVGCDGCNNSNVIFQNNTFNAGSGTDGPGVSKPRGAIGSVHNQLYNHTE